MGTSVIAAAVALSQAAWPQSLGFVLVAIGPLGAAFIDTDPITTPRQDVTGEQHPRRARLAVHPRLPGGCDRRGISVASDPAVGTILA
jgi:hypothetical protein